MSAAPREYQIIGAGLLGLCTAYALMRRGAADIRIIDQRPSVALGTSFANAGMVHTSLAAPWNGPGLGTQLIKAFISKNPAMQLRLRALPGLTRWGLSFLRASRSLPHWNATLANFALAERSAKITQNWRAVLDEQDTYDDDYQGNGLIKIFRKQAEFDKAITHSRQLAALGIAFETLSGAEVCAREPALLPTVDKLVGALYFPDDFKADAYQFACGLEAALRAGGAEFVLSSKVDGFIQAGGAVTGVSVSGQDYAAKTTILTAGARSFELAALLGLRLPVRPVKGYSLTFDGFEGSLPKYPVVDETLHAALTPLGGCIRIAGTAEITGFNQSRAPKHFKALLDMFRATYPNLADQKQVEEGSPWHGFRPVSADGIPFVGKTSIGGLALNTGHGHMGWTLCAGSGELLADLLLGTKPCLAPGHYAPARAKGL